MKEKFMGMEFVDFKKPEELTEAFPGSGSSKPAPIEVDPDDLGEFSNGEYDDHAFSKPAENVGVVVLDENEEIVEVIDLRENEE